jgi:hypothetical protein
MSALLLQLALVSESGQVPMKDVMKVAAALQKQATRDLAPIWEVSATVDAFETLEDVPLGYWPMIVKDNIGFNAAGIHLDKDGQPYALITASSDIDTWALTASHETLEMLVDPFGNRLVAGDSPKPGQGRVDFLVEVSDPSEDTQFGYSVNGILVSDFYTPRFFDPVPAPSVRYSFTAAVTKPRQVLRGGYLSWYDPVSDNWWQVRRIELEVRQPWPAGCESREHPVADRSADRQGDPEGNCQGPAGREGSGPHRRRGVELHVVAGGTLAHTDKCRDCAGTARRRCRLCAAPHRPAETPDIGTWSSRTECAILALDRREPIRQRDGSLSSECREVKTWAQDPTKRLGPSVRLDCANKSRSCNARARARKARPVQPTRRRVNLARASSFTSGCAS